MKHIIAIILACVAGAAPAQDRGANPISGDAVRGHIEFLADDLLEGRGPGARGHEIAARYVSSQFDALGLKPGNNGRWYQDVPFVNWRVDPAKGANLTIGNRSFALGDDVIVFSDLGIANQGFSAEAVFVGYGLEDKAQHLDDYRGLDLKGKIAVMLGGHPSGLSEDAIEKLRPKGEIAAAHGAIATIELVRPHQKTDSEWSLSNPSAWKGTADVSLSSRTSLADMPTAKNAISDRNIFIKDAAIAALFANAPHSFTQILATADKGERPRGFALNSKASYTPSLSLSPFSSPNVVAILPGSDPKLAHEYVVVTAHLDHFGIIPNIDGDRIMNGAMDNAAGVATVLEVARAFVASKAPPKRSVMFVAFTGEEKGDLGSKYFVQHSILPPGAKLVADVNIDMPILLYPLDDITAFGADRSTIGAALNRAASAAGLIVSPKLATERDRIERSDQFSFIQQGIPAVILLPGVKNNGDVLTQQFRKTHYHQPNDDMSQAFNWASAAKYAWVNYLLVRDIADAPTAPQWYAGDELGDRYAKAQPKAARP